jgi:hypothetical protein
MALRSLRARSPPCRPVQAAVCLPLCRCILGDASEIAPPEIARPRPRLPSVSEEVIMPSRKALTLLAAVFAAILGSLVVAAPAFAANKE